ncbi:Endoribonuclease L-PSP/chorismate mutase-like protein [Suillus subluteus]|nr:Endoribonuclease L-PSP/chorismate mutase-like protein [Suillus subluteus]
MSTITSVSTPNTPSAIGPYYQAIKAGEFVFVSGCIPLVPFTMQMAVLEASSSSVGMVVKTTVFLKNMEDFATVNKIYGTCSAVEVARLPKDVLFEIECIAG